MGRLGKATVPAGPHILRFPSSTAPPGDIPSRRPWLNVYVQGYVGGLCQVLGCSDRSRPPVSRHLSMGGRLIKSEQTQERFRSLGGTGGGAGSFFSGGQG